MTENKRFTFKDGYLFDDEKGNAFLTVGDCYELLNELHKKYIDEYTLRETLQLELQRVEEENKELKKKLKKKEKLIEAFEQYINDLREVGVLND